MIGRFPRIPNFSSGTPFVDNIETPIRDRKTQDLLRGLLASHYFLCGPFNTDDENIDKAFLVYEQSLIELAIRIDRGSESFLGET